MRRQQRRIVDTGKGNIGGGKLHHQRLDILRGEYLRHFGVGLRAVGLTLRIGGETLIGAERGVAQYLIGEHAPFAVVLDRDQNVGAVARLEHAVGRDGRMRQANALERGAPFLIEQRNGHPLRHGIEHGNRNRRAFAGAAAADDRLKDRLIGA